MKIAILYGAITALTIALVNSFFVDLFGIEYEFVRSYSGFFPFMILGIGLYLALRKTKETSYGNELNYGQGIYSGIVIAAFIALFSAVFNFFYFQAINTDYSEEVIKVAIPLMEKDQLKPDEIAIQVEKIKETYKPINQLTGTFVIMLIAGIVFSAIFSAFFRTKDTFTLASKEEKNK